MATPEQEKAERERLEGLLKELASLDPEKDLVREDALGAASFRLGLETFNRTISLFKDLRASQLGALPHAPLKQLADVAQGAKAHFDQVKAFSLDRPQPVKERDQLIEAIRNQYDTQFVTLFQYINYLTLKGVDFAALERGAKESIERINQLAGKEQEKQAEITSEMQDALQKVKQAAVEVGVGQQSPVFKEQADSHGKQSRWWLLATIAFGVFAALYALWSFHWAELSKLDAGGVGPHVRYVLSRLLILSILFYGLFFSSRQFSAHRHNEVVNRHRQNGLQTFETFIKGPGGPETKDAVILETTRSIFSSQASGYLKAEPEAQSPNIIEIIKRSIAGGGAGEGTP